MDFTWGLFHCLVLQIENLVLVSQFGRVVASFACGQAVFKSCAFQQRLGSQMGTGDFFLNMAGKLVDSAVVGLFCRGVADVFLMLLVIFGILVGIFFEILFVIFF